MSITEYETGSQTATIDTEHTLNAGGPETAAGLYMLRVDCAAMAQDGTVFDHTRMRLYEKVRTADTQRLAMSASLVGYQTMPLWQSPAFILHRGWDWKLIQEDGTGRAYPWSIVKVTDASNHSEGSQTCTLDTEHTLTGAESTAAVIQVWLDLNNFVIGDMSRLKIKSKARSGDTQRIVWTDYFSYAPTSKIYISPLIVVGHDWDVSIEQTDGTGRAVPWSIRKLGA